jgi:hypothetical protein
MLLNSKNFHIGMKAELSRYFSGIKFVSCRLSACPGVRPRIISVCQISFGAVCKQKFRQLILRCEKMFLTLEGKQQKNVFER